MENAIEISSQDISEAKQLKEGWCKPEITEISTNDGTLGDINDGLDGGAYDASGS